MPASHLRRAKVESLDQLRIMAQHPRDIDVSLGEGTLISRKTIHFQRNRNGRHWWLFDGITGTERYYTELQLTRDTIIVRAIEKGALLVELD